MHSQCTFAFLPEYSFEWEGAAARAIAIMLAKFHFTSRSGIVLSVKVDKNDQSLHQ